MESLSVGVLLRVLQAFLQASPTLLVGLIVAGVFRRLLGHEGTRRLFGGVGWRSLVRAWLLGMLLPVCSLGVIPVLREMRRAGVSTGALLAFGLTGPLFNPISVLYGLTLADPVVILAFSFCSLVIVTVVGLVWDYFVRDELVAEPEPAPVEQGYKRMLAVGVFAAREATSRSALYVLLGIAGVGLLSALLPHGVLQTSAEHDDPWAPLVMATLAVPAYATPMTAMVQLASMFQHGNSVGAAFALLVLGAGTNLGMIGWILVTYGWRRSSGWFGILVALVVALAYGVDGPLYPRGVEPAGHTHAFDIYCAPYEPNTTQVWDRTLTTLEDNLAAHEIVSIGSLLALVLVGAALRRFDATERLEAWLAQRSTSPASRYDLVLPAPVLGAVSLTGLVGLSVFGCYVYYPTPEEIFRELTIVNTEVIAASSSRNWEAALYWIPIYDDWTRKLEVSMVLRGRALTDYRRARGDVVRERLELLEHEVEDQEVDEARAVGMALHRAYRRLKSAYLDETPLPPDDASSTDSSQTRMPTRQR